MGERGITPSQICKEETGAKMFFLSDLVSLSSLSRPPYIEIGSTGK